MNQPNDVSWRSWNISIERAKHRFQATMNCNWLWYRIDCYEYDDEDDDDDFDDDNNYDDDNNNGMKLWTKANCPSVGNRTRAFNTRALLKAAQFDFLCTETINKTTFFISFHTVLLIFIELFLFLCTVFSSHFVFLFLILFFFF